MKKKLNKCIFSLISVLLFSCTTGTSANSINSSNDLNNPSTSDTVTSSVSNNNSEITTSDNIITSEDSATSNNLTTSEATTSQGGSSSTTSENKPSSDNTPVVDVDIKSQGTYIEACYATWAETNISKCKVEYKLSSSSTFIELDSELIRSIDSATARFDAVGLKEGKYDFNITTSSGKVLVMKNIQVTAADRSGYAFYNTTEGIGAYNQDGTLKKDAVVVYVNESNKNTVSANGKTGLAAIIKANTGTKPLCVRFIGRIVCDTRNSSGKYEGIYEMIKGLTDKPTSDGTYFNMLDIESCKNITLEGIGDDAEIYQWGMEFMKCSSIEVKNLIYSKYTDDACGVEGDTSNPSKYSRFYIHNNRFNVGENKYNDTPEHDKAEGDGSTDVKGVSYATYAYNSYYSCHKTGLVGGSDSNLTSHLTFHHNYYSNCYSRLPLGRQANMHYYNNYFEKTQSTCMDLRANAYVFSEANYFKSSKNPVKTASGTACKSYNDVFDGCSGTNNATKVTSRDAKVSNSCKYGSSFDTDSSNFYYDSTKKKSIVSYLTDANQAMIDAKNYSGPGHINPSYNNQGSSDITTSSSNKTTSSSSTSKTSSSSSKSSSSSSIINVIPSGEKEVFNAANMASQTYSSSFESGMFTIKANSSKTVEIKDSDKFTSFDSSYTKVLNLAGGGSSDYRCIYFTLEKDAIIKVYARASSSRTLAINDASDNQVNSSEVNSTAKEITWTISKGTYYIMSTNSGIEVAAVTINY